GVGVVMGGEAGGVGGVGGEGVVRRVGGGPGGALRGRVGVDSRRRVNGQGRGGRSHADRLEEVTAAQGQVVAGVTVGAAPRLRGHENLPGKGGSSAAGGSRPVFPAAYPRPRGLSSRETHPPGRARAAATPPRGSSS